MNQRTTKSISSILSNKSRPATTVKNPILIKQIHHKELLDSELQNKICESEIVSNDSHNLKPINSSRLQCYNDLRRNPEILRKFLTPEPQLETLNKT